MPEHHKDIRLQAEGIVCAGCATDMETVLRDLDGIISVRVDYGKGLLDIRYDPAELERREIVRKVNSLGFKARELPAG